MKVLFKKILFLLLLVTFITLMGGSLQEVCAQCQTCKANVETNLASGGTIGLGLNVGILYLLAAPYALVLGLGGFWLYKRKKAKQMAAS